MASVGLRPSSRPLASCYRASAGTDPPPLLAPLRDRGRVTHFGLAHPSLHDVFVRIADPNAAQPTRDQAMEVEHA